MVTVSVTRVESVNNIGTIVCGCGAAGSASPCQGEGRGFESRHPFGRGQIGREALDPLVVD